VTPHNPAGYIPPGRTSSAPRTAMLRPGVIALLSLAATLAACGADAACGGTGPTCPFAPPSHHAVVNGVVLRDNDQPVAGAYTSVRFPDGSGFHAGGQTDATGHFTITVRRDHSPAAPDTLRGWARAAKEVSSQTGSNVGTIVRDSMSIVVRLRPRTDPPLVTEAIVRLPITL
jgi:hypothetical protein